MPIAGWATLAVLGVTVLVLVLWYRSISNTLLESRTPGMLATDFLRRNRIESPVRFENWSKGTESIDVVRSSLAADYKLLRFLVRDAVDLADLARSVEMRFLSFDFQLMALLDALLGWASKRLVAATLRQRSRVVLYAATAIAERLSMLQR